MCEISFYEFWVIIFSFLCSSLPDKPQLIERLQLYQTSIIEIQIIGNPTVFVQAKKKKNQGGQGRVGRGGMRRGKVWYQDQHIIGALPGFPWYRF